MRRSGVEDGGAGWVTLAILGFAVLLLIGGFAFCDLLIEDESEPGDEHFFGRAELVSHDYGDEYGGGDYDNRYGSEDDRNRNRNRDRGAFSPGPFRDSPVTICAPYSCNSGGEQSGGDRENPPDDEREMR